MIKDEYKILSYRTLFYHVICLRINTNLMLHLEALQDPPFRSTLKLPLGELRGGGRGEGQRRQFVKRKGKTRQVVSTVDSFSKFASAFFSEINV
jgi:hypothetical protein